MIRRKLRFPSPVLLSICTLSSAFSDFPYVGLDWTNSVRHLRVSLLAGVRGNVTGAVYINTAGGISIQHGWGTCFIIQGVGKGNKWL